MCSINCSSNYLCIVFIALSFINISSTSVSSDTSFSEKESCFFPLGNGLIIDLSPLVNSDQPMYTSTNTSLYVYHPCKDVQLKTAKPNECQEYQLCYFVPSKPTNKPVDFNDILSGKLEGNFSLLAYKDEGIFREVERKYPQIVYKHSNSSGTIVAVRVAIASMCSPLLENHLQRLLPFFFSSVMITTLMWLECNHKIDNYTLTISKTSSTKHELTLSSKYICVNTESHLSGGAVFFIILLVFAALYFIGGVLVLKFIRGATGIEMIPNHEFWCRVPQMTKDGIAYLSSCGKRAPDSYEKI